MMAALFAPAVIEKSGCRAAESGMGMDVAQLGDPSSWDWISIAKTAFGAGLGTATVQGGIAFYRERSRRTDSAAYLALRIAVLLEAFASECCDFYFSNANAQHSPDEQYPAWRTELPMLPQFPDDTEAWRAMDRSLVARCLNFPNRVRASQNAIASAIEYTESDLEYVLDEQVSARGVEAWEIASSLRGTYKLDRTEIVFDFDDVLHKVLQTSREAINQRAKQQAELLKELSANDRDIPDEQSALIFRSSPTRRRPQRA
jgi:hypothetical protein